MTTCRAAILSVLFTACSTPHDPVDPAEARQICHAAATIGPTLDVIAAALRTRIPVPDEKFALTAGPPILGAGGNTVVIDAADLDVPGAVDGNLRATKGDLGPDTIHVLDIATKGIDRSSLKVEQGDVARLRKVCDQVGAARYALIVHTNQSKVAYAARGDTFMPGVMTGTVHLYELPSGHHLGAFAMTASNSDSVHVRVNEDVHGSSELQADLRNNYWWEIQARVRELGGG
ncbi:MAG: hypothetical protein K8W52_27515 [Deltaproteobacteria bacterium]|nr:hypothetical protein [Deltaproteobacteria bacterium]